MQLPNTMNPATVIAPAVLPPVPSLLPDIKGLIAASRPRPGLGIFRPGTGLGFLVAGMVVAVLPIDLHVRIALVTIIGLAFFTSFAVFWWMVRAYRTETVALSQIEDLVALRRHHDAGLRLQWLMASPMRTEQNRLRAIFLLGATLSRLLRFEDCLIAFNELVQTERIAGTSSIAVKLGRAMAMLHSDHLYDADSAINELRRLIDRGGVEAEMRKLDVDAPIAPPEAPIIAALRLVELYRDIKTGHSSEATALFENNLPLMRAGLGHRVGEAHALVAVAYDRLGNESAARQRFGEGTALQAVADLLNLYPELRTLLGKYAPTIPPPLA
ncbi:MAG: hypothetical protein H7144_02615 [Burkholderiales bacterium]|nr:hypothetical protein [Phycisphaerae bacterium]